MADKKIGGLPRVWGGGLAQTYSDFEIVNVTLSDDSVTEVTVPDFAAAALIQDSNEGTVELRKTETGAGITRKEHRVPVMNVNSFWLKRTDNSEQTIEVFYLRLAGGE